MSEKTKNPPPEPAGQTAEAIFEALRNLPAAERAKAEALTGFPLPEIRADETVGERIFGARCSYCGELGLEFLGLDDPIGLPWEHTRWVQDKGIHKTPPMRRHRPICQHCNNVLGEGKIRGKHRVRIKTYSKFRSEQANRKVRYHDPFLMVNRQSTLTDHEGRSVTLPTTEIPDAVAMSKGPQAQGRPNPRAIDTSNMA